MKYVNLAFILLLSTGIGKAQKSKNFQLLSPNGDLTVNITTDTKLQWSVLHKLQNIIMPSAISMQLKDGSLLGDNMVITSTKVIRVKEVIDAINYKKDKIDNVYNQLLINCKGAYGIIFRAYNDGVAYRFFTKKKDSIIIQSEEANFNFDKDYQAFIPYARDLRDHEKYTQSFEALYDHINLSKFEKDTLAFLPLLVDMGNNKKVAILEADLEDYPGMFININQQTRQGLQGVYAPYPLEEKNGGYSNINYIATKRANYIARTRGTRTFPWRVVVISENDKDLANNDMVQKLASPPRISNISWIKPGKVAWDWWNDWNISHVDFKAGINTATYKYYIDFAAANNIEYIIMDEGWSESSDMRKISSKINMEEIIAYGKQKNVGVILWASWYAVTRIMDEVFDKYARMGIKGFKIDFLDRDDQKMVASVYEIAKSAAKYKLLVDFHGMYKPTGMQRTYPNLINFEGVKGMENVKWTPNDDVPKYDVTIPFVRMMAGPMDYTPGAMRNATKSNFRPSNSLPMSQGTRCHQLAMYVVFEAPLQMLADNPTAYMKEQESTSFISKVPTTFDETVALDGKVGSYVAIARRKENTWYVGAMSNWEERDLNIDFSFLGEGNYEAEIFKDGMNADKDATDYKREVIAISSKDKMFIHLSNGGGWAARIYKK